MRNIHDKTLEDRIFGTDRKNAYQELHLIKTNDPIPESESDYDADMILVTKYLRDQGFTEDSILVDNTW